MKLKQALKDANALLDGDFMQATIDQILAKRNEIDYAFYEKGFEVSYDQENNQVTIEVEAPDEPEPLTKDHFQPDDFEDEDLDDEIPEEPAEEEDDDEPDPQDRYWVNGQERWEAARILRQRNRGPRNDN